MHYYIQDFSDHAVSRGRSMKSDFGGYLKLFGLKTQAAGNSISAYAFRKTKGETRPLYSNYVIMISKFTHSLIEPLFLKVKKNIYFKLKSAQHLLMSLGIK